MKFRRFFAFLLAFFLLLSSAFAAPLSSDPSGNSDTMEEQGPTDESSSDDADMVAGSSEEGSSDSGSPSGDDQSSGDEETGNEEGAPTRPVIQIYDPDAGFPAVDNFEVAGTAALLYDRSSDTLLYTQNPDEKVYPASLTKLTTALVLIENGNLDDTTTVSANAVNSVSARTGDLEIGETLKIHDLLYSILMSSSNEACNVAAEYLCGSISDFVDLMNEKAAALGCTGTHYANTHGLHDEDHYTTARDLLYITQAVLANDTLREIVFATSYEMPATNMQPAKTIYTTNYMTSTDLSYKYYYSLAKGVKTGYTSAAGRCLIVTAAQDQLDLLAIVLGCETTEDEHGEYVLHSFLEAKSLFEYGFSNFEFVTVLSSMIPIAEVPVSGGANASVVVAPTSDSSIVLPKEYDPDDVTTEVTLNSGSAVQAPFEAGDVVGTVSVYYRGKFIRSADVAAITGVEAGNAVFYSETPVNEESGMPEGAKTGGLSVWAILLIIAGLFLILYIVSYVYFNLTKKKSKPVARHGTRSSSHSRAGSPVRTGSRKMVASPKVERSRLASGSKSGHRPAHGEKGGNPRRRDSRKR